MVILFVTLIVLLSVILGLIVLVQNPKGGGVAGSLGGFSNQLMGVKQTTDIMEKGTWIFAALIAVLCITSPFFIKGRSGGGKSSIIDNAPVNAPKNAAPQKSAAPMPGVQQNTPAAKPDSNK